MPEYRLLADSMWSGEKNEKRHVRGDMVEVDEDRAKPLIAKGLLVEKGQESKSQKAEFEAMDKVAESAQANLDEIKKQEAALMKQGGETENRTALVDPAKQVTGRPAGNIKPNKE